MPFDFTDRTILVTGAASGIGRAVAARFHAAGATVVATDIDGDGLFALEAELGPRCRIRAMDAGDESSILATLEALRAEFGRLDGVVNNAGLARLEPIAGLTGAAVDAQFAVLLKGPMLITRSAAPLMAQAGNPAIVNIASIAALIQAGGHAVYSACKAGLVKFTADAAKEYPAIRSNVVLPGFIDTPILKAYGEGEALESLKREIAARVPRRRLGRPDEIADACLFLCSPLASYISGAALVVDGGVTATALEWM